jgi:PEP-CTERM motif
MRSLLSSLILLALSTPSFAVDLPVPEPGSLSLVGLGIAAAIAVKLMKSKK